MTAFGKLVKQQFALCRIWGLHVTIHTFKAIMFNNVSSLRLIILCDVVFGDLVVIFYSFIKRRLGTEVMQSLGVHEMELLHLRY